MRISEIFGVPWSTARCEIPGRTPRQPLSSLCRLYSMYTLSSQNSIRAAQFRVVLEGLRAHGQACLLKGSLD